MKDIFYRISELRTSGRIFALATMVKAGQSTPRKPGARMIVFQNGKIEGTIGGGKLEQMVIEDATRAIQNKETTTKVYILSEGKRAENTGMICGGKVEIFIEVFPGNLPRLVIFGGGHIAQKLGPMARLAGIPFWVVDDRKAFASEDRFPEAERVIHSPFSKAFSKIKITKSTYVVIVTNGHKGDAICLEKALKTPACYIGMIGSRVKVKTTFAALEKKGVRIGKEKRVYAPIGLKLGDHTPGEIAVSILSEIIKLKSGGTAEHLSKK